MGTTPPWTQPAFVTCAWLPSATIELVDSICRESVDTQYMIIQIQNLKNDRRISLYDNVYTIHLQVFWWPTRLKDIVKSTEQGNHQKCFFFLCLLLLLLLGVSYFYFCFFFFFFVLFVVVVQNCMTLSQWFSYKAAAFYTEQCTTPLLFHYFEVSQVLNQIEAFFAGFTCVTLHMGESDPSAKMSLQ